VPGPWTVYALPTTCFWAGRGPRLFSVGMGAEGTVADIDTPPPAMVEGRVTAWGLVSLAGRR
jgi:hypothetical protein